MHVKSIPGAAGQAPDPRVRAIKALVAIAIEHTEDRVVAALLRRPLFGALDDTDGSGSLRVVRDHHLGRGQLEVYACRLEVPLLRLTLAYNQSNRATRTRDSMAD